MIADFNSMITVISDSHIPGRAEKIPEKFWEKIENSEIAVHAGDFASEEVFNAIQEYSNKAYCVKGNCDFFKDNKLKESETFQYKGIKFGVYHGTGISPRGHKPTLEKIAVDDLNVDILIHGHTHQEQIEQTDRTLLINPGSCTGVGGGSSRPSTPSMITIKIESGEMIIKILEKKEDDSLTTIRSEEFSVEEIKR